MWSRVPFGGDLRAELGSPGRSRRLGSSPRSRVWRVELAGAPAVVKQIVDGPDADDLYTREVTALRLAARADTPVAPQLLGTDPGQRVLVLEYLEHQRPSSDWIVDYAAALARLPPSQREWISTTASGRSGAVGRLAQPSVSEEGMYAPGTSLGA